MAIKRQPVWKRPGYLVGAAAIALFLALLWVGGWSTEMWLDIDEEKASWWRWRVSIAAANTSVIALAAALAYGPLVVLRGGRPLVHRSLRRAMGVWAGVFALLHVAVAMGIHADLFRPWENYVVFEPFTLVRGSIGLANWLGAAQVVIFVVLIGVSRTAMLRQLGASRWERLQRTTYPLVGLVAIHAFLYHRVEQRLLAHRVLVFIPVAIVFVIQVAGFVTVKRRPGLNHTERQRSS